MEKVFAFVSFIIAMFLTTPVLAEGGSPDWAGKAGTGIEAGSDRQGARIEQGFGRERRLNGAGERGDGKQDMYRYRENTRVRQLERNRAQYRFHSQQQRR